MTRQAIEMKTMYLMNALLISSIVSIVSISDALPVITSTPGIQRKSLGDSCIFQWTVTAPLDSYTVYNLTNGSLLPLRSHSKYNEKNGIVTLIIWNIQFRDAGNYSLSATVGTETENDSSALLFVFGSVKAFINQTSGSNPTTQGETVELTCMATSTSLPAEYLPRMHYHWYISRSQSDLRGKRISIGPAIFGNGDPLPGYNIKNDGSTLVINSAQYPESFRCDVEEDGAPERTSWAYSDRDYFKLQLHHRPYTTSRIPDSGIVTAVIGEEVDVLIIGQANADDALNNRWHFVDTAGHAQGLPSDVVPIFHKYRYATHFSAGLKFRLSWAQYYGKYSLTISNNMGSTTETFQVRPPGRPDPPSDFRVIYASHSAIKLRWFTMWDNGHQQTIFVQLKAVGNETAIATWIKTMSFRSYNVREDHIFSDNIHPETDYEARIWSTNELGTSSVVKRTTRTLKQPKLYVSAETISLNGSQAIINYSTADGNITYLYVSYCVEFTGYCANNELDVSDTKGQVVFNNLPNAHEYIFGITAYSGNPEKDRYFAARARDVRVSTAGDPTVDKSELSAIVDKSEDIAIVDKSQIIVIVLSTALGLALLALIGCSVAFLVSKCRGDGPPITTPSQKNGHS